MKRQIIRLKKQLVNELDIFDEKNRKKLIKIFIAGSILVVLFFLLIFSASLNTTGDYDEVEVKFEQTEDSSVSDEHINADEEAHPDGISIGETPVSDLPLLGGDGPLGFSWLTWIIMGMMWFIFFRPRRGRSLF